MSTVQTNGHYGAFMIHFELAQAQFIWFPDFPNLALLARVSAENTRGNHLLRLPSLRMKTGILVCATNSFPKSLLAVVQHNNGTS